VPERDGPESPDGVVPKHQSWRVPAWLTRWSRHKDIAILAVGVVFAGVSAVVGIGHVAWPWIFAAVCAGAAAAGLAARALDTRKAKDRLRSLWAAVAVLCAILGFVFAYHQWWDPARHSGQIYQVIVDGGGNDAFLPYDYPGGTQGYVYGAIVPQSTMELECYVALPTSGVWYRILDNGGWIPQDGVHAIPGFAFPSPPHC
jgi:hypothetical protein